MIVASNMGYIPIVKALLEKNAKIEIQNDENKTALDAAKEKGHTEILRLLSPVRHFDYGCFRKYTNKSLCTQTLLLIISITEIGATA